MSAWDAHSANLPALKLRHFSGSGIGYSLELLISFYHLPWGRLNCIIQHFGLRMRLKIGWRTLRDRIS
jgi:hypothetical protein